MKNDGTDPNATLGCSAIYEDGKKKEKGTEWCHPEKVECEGEVVESQPCPEPDKLPMAICVCHTAKPCPVHLKLNLKYTTKGCDPHPCITSIPPDLGCVPIRAGVGKWDGGIPRWTAACLKDCDLEVWHERYPHETTPFSASQGQSTLDLNTHPEHTTNLQVIADYVPRQINVREFFALAVKMYETGMCVSKGVNPNSLELGYVQAEDGSMMISIISKGVAVGTGVALIPQTDDMGNVIGMMLPPPA